MCILDTVSANTSLQKRGGRTITTRHYLDFINHYVSFCVLICDQWFNQWLIDLMLSDQVRVIRLLAFINAVSNFLSSVPLLPLPLSFSSFSLSLPLLQVKLYNEKRQDLVEQQLHLNVGLQKIRETVDQVEELQASQ